MGTSAPAARLARAGFAYFVVFVATAEALRSYFGAIAAGGAFFQTADWLINYSDGFVRRGLFGSAYLALFPHGQAGLWVLFVVQVLLSAVPIVYAMAWLHRSSYGWLGIALVCGPASLTFTGWDPAAFARKESLALSALSLLAVAAFPDRRPGIRRALIIGALILFTVGVFSWEGNALFLPGVAFLLFAGASGRDSRWEDRLYLLVAALIAGSGMAFSVLFPGTATTSVAVCDSLRAKGLDRSQLCDGAIGYLSWTGDQMLSVIRESFPLYWGYLPLMALSLLPIVSTRWFRAHWWLAIACVVAVAPLFVVAADYGRWTSVLVVELVICLMATHGTQTESNQWTPVASVLYVTTWGIPHWLAPGMEWPWLGALKEVTQFLAGHGPPW